MQTNDSLLCLNLVLVSAAAASKSKAECFDFAVLQASKTFSPAALICWSLLAIWAECYETHPEFEGEQGVILLYCIRR